MNILLIGSGGREHAIAWKIAKNKRVEKTYILKNNTKEIQRYRLSTTTNNVVVTPKTFVLGAGKEKEIKLTAVGRGKKGENNYYFVVEESIVNRKKLKKNQAGAYMNKTVRFEQSYYLK